MWDTAAHEEQGHETGLYLQQYGRGHPRGTISIRPCLVEEWKALRSTLGPSHSFPDPAGGIHDELGLPEGWEATSPTPLFPCYSLSLIFNPPSPCCLHKHDYVILQKLIIAFIFLFSRWLLKPMVLSNLKQQWWQEKHSLWGIVELKILTASEFESVFIHNGTSVFLTWKVLKYLIQGINNFESNNRLLNILHRNNRIHGQTIQRSVLMLPPPFFHLYFSKA